MNPPAAPPTAAEIPELDVRRYFRIFWKFKWVFLIVAAGVASAVIYRTMSAPKVFQAVTVIQISPLTPRVHTEIREVVELGTGTYWANREYLNTQYQVITSRIVAQRVVERLGLDRDPA
jgi:succinoglycan biosynthesis transport protein ExoP